MNFGLTDEQEMVVNTVRTFVENEIYPLEKEVEKIVEKNVGEKIVYEKVEVPKEVIRKELVYGEDDRKNYAQAPSILQLFTGIKFNYHRLFLHYGYFDLWLIMYNQTMIIVPYLLMGPGLFTGAMTLGVLIQTSSAFREVQSSFSLFLQNWTRITELRSIHKRLMEFEVAINFKNKLRKPRKSDVRA